MAQTEARNDDGREVIDPELLEILVCPACRANVELAGERLVCQGCGRKYRIEDGIPIMLIDQAEM